MKRYTPTLEAYSWASLDDHDTEVRPVMQEDPDGGWVRIEDVQDMQFAELERLLCRRFGFDPEQLSSPQASLTETHAEAPADGGNG